MVDLVYAAALFVASNVFSLYSALSFDPTGRLLLLLQYYGLQNQNRTTGSCSPRDTTSNTSSFPDEYSTSVGVDDGAVHNRQKQTDRTNKEAQKQLGVS